MNRTFSRFPAAVLAVVIVAAGCARSAEIESEPSPAVAVVEAEPIVEGDGLLRNIPRPAIDPAPDPIPDTLLPEPGVERRTADARSVVDVRHYDLTIDLRRLADTTFEARAALRLMASPGASHVDLDFVGMRVDSVRIDGARAKFAQGPDLLRIVPNEAFDEEADVEVFYGGTPKEGLFIGPDPAGDLTAFADNWPNRARWWFPSNDYPADKATVRFEIQVPEGYQAVANGRLVSSEDNAWIWRTDVEIPAYTMVVGVAQFERATIGEAACGEAPALGPDGCVEVSTWALPGSGAYGEQRFSRAPDMVDFYTEMFGPYPYEKLAHVHSSTRFGGMENSSAIFYAMGGWAEERMGEGVIAHETVHQWFGDGVTPSDWSHLWVSEGFATYFAAVYFGGRDGEEAFRAAMNAGRDRIIGSEASNRPVVDERNDLYGLLNTNSYPKGAWILHMLRSMIGDEAFFEAVRAYYAEHENGVADTEGVKAAVETASGEDLGWFFEQWAYSPGFPRLQVTSRRNDGDVLVIIEQVQDAEWPTFRLPLVVKVRTPDGRFDESRELWMEGRQEILRFEDVPGAGVPEVHIDPEDTLLLEVLDDA